MKIDNILYLDDKEDQIVSEVICINCKLRWINVRPYNVSTCSLTCQYCEQEGYILDTGEAIDDLTFERVCKKYPKLNIYREKKFMYKYD